LKNIIFALMGLILSLTFVGCNKTSSNANTNTISSSNYQNNKSDINNSTIYQNNKSDINNSTITSNLGILKFKVINPTSKVLKYAYSASGELIATPDKLENAIDKAKEINKKYITSLNNEYKIVMKSTSNAAVAVFSQNKKYGLILSEKQVKSGKTTDLGYVNLLATKSLSLKIDSIINENVELKINLIGIDEIVPTNKTLIINNIPQGKHLITISRNKKTILSRYIEVSNNNPNIEININNYHSVKMKGMILDKDNNPIDSAMIFLKPTKDNYLIALTNNNGEFEFNNLMNGSFTLIVKKSGYKAVKKENIKINGNNLDIGKITLKKDVSTGSIEGYAYFNDSNQHAGIDITIEKIGGGYETNQVGTLPDGAFLITNLPEGKYTLHFGKSADSEYSQEDVKNIEVVSGTTRILEKPIILTHQLAYIQGKLHFPNNFTNNDLSNIEIKACNENNKCYPYNITSLDKNKTTEFNISVPSKYQYTLSITGKDAEGNDINIIKKDIDTLTSGENYLINNTLNITYVDPNPPMINSITVTKVLGILKNLGNNTYFVNPGDKIQLDVTAQDLDGDRITYTFDDENGKLSGVNQKSGIATYQAPDNGGEYTITVIASDGSRKTSKTLTIKVNHYPLIQLISPKDVTNKQEPKTYKEGEETTINTDISDVEDDNLTIEWYSSLQGRIEENISNLNKILIPGNHVITVFTRDSLGLISSKQFFVKINPQNTIWLRTPNSYIKRYTTSDGIALNDTYQISIASSYDLKYKSNNENVVTVDNNGLITAVHAGSAKIIIYSKENDTNGNPLYSFKIYVRVIGDITKQTTTPYHIKPGQIYQVRVNKDHKPEIILDINTSGNYEFLTLDNHDVINNSVTCVNYYINGNQNGNGCGVGNAIFNVDVVDPNDDFKMYLYPNDEDNDEIVKVAFVPTANVIKNEKTISSFFFDSNNEFNDINQLSKEVNLYTATISETSVLDYDKYDYYYLNVKKIGTYNILFQTLTGTSSGGFKYIQIYNPNGTKILDKYLYSYSTGVGLYSWNDFSAKEIGKYKIKIFNDKSYSTYYQFNIYPSIKNNLIQDSDGEINDLPSMATAITLNKAEKGIKGDVYVRKTDIADWYELDINQTGTYNILFQTLTGTSYKGYKYIQIYNPNGTKILDKDLHSYSTGVGLRGEYILNLLEKGKYKIKIFNDASYPTYYEFNITQKD